MGKLHNRETNSNPQLRENGLQGVQWESKNMVSLLKISGLVYAHTYTLS